MSHIISFDIDGTIESGGPPGIITSSQILRLRQMGHLIGSASDRTVTDQYRIWREMGIEPDFVVLKHRLTEVRSLFPAAEGYWHIGDGHLDKKFGEEAGFTYMEPGELSTRWVPGQEDELPEVQE